MASTTCRGFWLDAALSRKIRGWLPTVRPSIGKSCRVYARLSAGWWASMFMVCMLTLSRGPGSAHRRSDCNIAFRQDALSYTLLVRNSSRYGDNLWRQYGMIKQSQTRGFICPAILMALALCLAGNALAQALSREVRTQLISATVQVVPWDDIAGDLAPWSGSGTIISQDGYVLTNYHVVGDIDSRNHFEWHAISMTDVNAADLPPAHSYWARYVAGDPLLDLAVLRIEEYPDESPVPAGTVFPAVPVGDSHTLLPGDGLTVVGYPGISGSTITFTQGIMSGWLGEDLESGGRQWIKTDAKIAGGNSGGAAVNERGELVGIPTAGFHVLDGEMYEEQLYIRPIALAWALIGPHVANVVRPSLASSPTPATVQTPAVTEPVPANSNSPVTQPGTA